VELDESIMPDTNALSDREIEILQLVATGLTNREIAQSLTISPNTVKVHLRNIFDKIEVSSRTEATMYGIEHGIVDVPGSEGNLTQPGSLNMVQKLPWVFMAIVLAVVLLVVVGGNLLFPSATPTPNALPAVPDRWQELAPMPEPRAGMAAATYDGSIYAIAGEGLESVSGSVFRYITAEDRWEQLKDKPTPVTDVEGVLIGEKIYVPGGRLEGGENTDVLEVYDPRRDCWEQKTSLPVKVSGYAMTDFEGQIYLFGGTDGENVIDVALRYDPQEDEWENLTPLSTARAYAGAASAGGKIFVIGGWDGEKALDINESYSPTRDIQGGGAWQTESNLPAAGFSMGVESLAEMVFVVGGDVVWQFTTGSDTWNYDESKIPFDSKYDFGFSLLESYIFIIGGKNNYKENLSNVYRYQAIYSFVLPIIKK